MRYKKILLFIMCYFTFTSGVSAAICDNNHIKQLKELAEQVDVSYEYIDYTEEIINNPDGEYPLNSYSININLLSEELYINDGYQDYFYEDSNDGMIDFIVNSGNLKLTVLSNKCKNIKLKIISLQLPKFNTYSYRNECNELSDYNLDVCDPWYQGTLNDNYFYNVVNEYLNKPEEKEDFLDAIVRFYKEYQLIIIISVLLIVLGIIAFFMYRKRSVLE